METIKTKPSTKILGRHLLLELYDCNVQLLNDTAKIEAILKKAALKVGATIVDTSFHHFSPYGVSGVVVIAESHITIHTWPEYAYAGIDLFTCDKTIETSILADYLREAFAACRFEQSVHLRGNLDTIKGDH